MTKPDDQLPLTPGQRKALLEGFITLWNKHHPVGSPVLAPYGGVVNVTPVSAPAYIDDDGVAVVMCDGVPESLRIETVRDPEDVLDEAFTGEVGATAMLAPARHPGVHHLLQFFGYRHLPRGPLAETSALFHNLAYTLVADRRLNGPELTVALRKLLEAKDAAVRSAL